MANCIHQGKKITADLVYWIPFNRIVYTKPYSYICHEGWFKSIAIFTHLFVKLTRNKRIILFGEHDSRFGAYQMDIMVSKCAQSFILKSGDSENAQPNHNVAIPTPQLPQRIWPKLAQGSLKRAGHYQI